MNISKVSKFIYPAWSEMCYRWKDYRKLLDEKGPNPPIADKKKALEPICKGCYAFNSYRRMTATVKKAWDENADASCADVYEYVKEYCTILTPRFFRIYVAGEFTPDRFDMWIRLAKKCKKTTFWSYSKEIWLSQYTLPKNMIIKLNPDINYGSEVWCEDMIRDNPERFYLCPCHLDKNACGRKCFQCMINDGRLPLFVKH